jgi:hypothetical protein
MAAPRDKIRDVVLPVASAALDPADGIKLTAFLGTAFLIGTGHYALTARHVADSAVNVPMVLASATDEGEFYGHEVEVAENHPTEDVAILKLGSPLWSSWLQLAGTFETQTLSYRSWGYPENVLHEVITDDIALPRPDLIYTEGYVRRRLSMALPDITGTQFFELSDAAGVRRMLRLPCPAPHSKCRRALGRRWYLCWRARS